MLMVNGTDTVTLNPKQLLDPLRREILLACRFNMLHLIHRLA